MPNLRLALRMLFRTPALTAHRHPVAGDRHRRQRRDLLALQPDAAAAAAGGGSLRAGQPGRAGAEARVAVVEQRRVAANTPSATRCSATSRRRRRGSAASPPIASSKTNLAFEGQTTSGLGMLVSGSYFGVLGLTPAAGRLIGPEDDRTPGAHQVAVLSHGYWRTRFAMSPAVIGSTIVVNAVPMTIIGVAPGGLHRHHARRAAADLRPDLDARAPRRRVQGPRQPAQLLGLPLRPAAAGRDHRAGQGRRRRALRRHRQRRRGRPAEGHERGDAGPLQGQAGHRRARRPRPEQRHARRAARR